MPPSVPTTAMPSLTTADGVRSLTNAQARELSGAQIDAIVAENLHGYLGSKWLMREQECEYSRPARLDDNPVRDVAVLMVDDRSPLPYSIPGTSLESPKSWGLPRTPLTPDFLPPRWGSMTAERANAMADAILASAGQASAPSTDGADEGGGAGDEEDDDMGGASEARTGGDASHSSGSGSGSGGSSSSSSGSGGVGSFQLSAIINHIFAELHDYHFYLERPCVNVTRGVDEKLWEKSLAVTLRRTRRGKWTPKHAKYLKTASVCAGLSVHHRLGPFPPRSQAWSKLAAIRYIARRHAYVLYLDSDAFITKVWRPIDPLLSLLGDKWLAVAGEYPPQKLRKDTRAGEANSGVLLFAGLPTAGPGVLRMIEDWIWPFRGVALAAFTWPYEQNALSAIVLKYYGAQVARLQPGCPLNSPFGAFVRHYVGGTPDRTIYHPNHRAGWLLQALRCTVELVSHAANASAAARSGAASGPGFRGAASDALHRPEGCAPNEPTLAITVGGMCGGVNGGVPSVSRGQQPVGAHVLSRVHASWWRHCCALCVVHLPCRGWTFDDDWPAGTRNCVLLDRVGKTVTAEESRLVGRIPARGASSTSGLSATPRGATSDVLVTYEIPTVGPWEM